MRRRRRHRQPHYETQALVLTSSLGNRAAEQQGKMIQQKGVEEYGDFIDNQDTHLSRHFWGCFACIAVQDLMKRDERGALEQGRWLW